MKFIKTFEDWKGVSPEIKSTSYEGKDFVANVKMIAKSDKNALRKYFDGHSTSVETCTIK